MFGSGKMRQRIFNFVLLVVILDVVEDYLFIFGYLKLIDLRGFVLVASEDVNIVFEEWVDGRFCMGEVVVMFWAVDRLAGVAEVGSFVHLNKIKNFYKCFIWTKER